MSLSDKQTASSRGAGCLSHHHGPSTQHSARHTAGAQYLPNESPGNDLEPDLCRLMRWPLISVMEAAVEAWGLQGDTDTLRGSSSALRAWITWHLRKLPTLPARPSEL